MTPFQALYGVTPTNPVAAAADAATLPTVKDWIVERQRLTSELRDRLYTAQNRMKQQADKHRREKEYAEGDWVYLKLQPYRQLSVAARKNPKLAARYHGPFQIIARVGAVAYRLRLPEDAQVHPVFHVSQLKQSPSSGEKVTPGLASIGSEGQFLASPERILDQRPTNRGGLSATEVLVKWVNLPLASATWEDRQALRQQFPEFDS